MQGCKDYYRFLQVHMLAETEIIESAFRRLAKKYHPDINREKDAGLKMRLLNEAYEILRDPEKRREYDIELSLGKSHSENTVHEDCAVPAKRVLDRYFACIKGRRYDEAYELISGKDKSRISLDDFVRWQAAVSGIYHLQEYDCKTGKVNINDKLDGFMYLQTAEFVITTVEHNVVMNRKEKDILRKKVVLEIGGWRIFVGHKDIRPLIGKFEELNGLLVAKSVIQDMAELYSNTDNLTGLLNKKGFIEASEKEVWRHGRYGNAFSLLLLDICQTKPDAAGDSIRRAGSVLKDLLRKLDMICRWNDSQFLVLLPETSLPGAVCAAEKVLKELEKDQTSIVRIGVEEYRGSLENALERLDNHIAILTEKVYGNHIRSGGG